MSENSPENDETQETEEVPGADEARGPQESDEENFGADLPQTTAEGFSDPAGGLPEPTADRGDIA